MYHQPLMRKVGRGAFAEPGVRGGMMLTQIVRSTSVKAKLFRGLADASRLAILEAVCERPRSVTEVMELTGLTQSNVSNHLSCLLGCGLVVREQRGRFAYYRISDPRVSRLLELGEELLTEVASGVDRCAHLEDAE